MARPLQGSGVESDRAMDLRLPQTPVSLVVAERGVDWGLWVERFQTGTPDVVVIAQRPGETIGQLSQRVRERVEALESSGHQVARAVIAGAGGPAASTLAARHSTIKAIVAPMVKQCQGTLLLDGQGSDRFSMTALATTVATMVRGTGVKVVATDHPVANVA